MRHLSTDRKNKVYVSDHALRRAVQRFEWAASLAQNASTPVLAKILTAMAFQGNPCGRSKDAATLVIRSTYRCRRTGQETSVILLVEQAPQDKHIYVVVTVMDEETAEADTALLITKPGKGAKK